MGGFIHQTMWFLQDKASLSFTFGFFPLYFSCGLSYESFTGLSVFGSGVGLDSFCTFCRSCLLASICTLAGAVGEVRVPYFQIWEPVGGQRAWGEEQVSRGEGSRRCICSQPASKSLTLWELVEGNICVWRKAVTPLVYNFKAEMRNLVEVLRWKERSYTENTTFLNFYSTAV